VRPSTAPAVPPTANTPARPGDVIRSGSWAVAVVDFSIAGTDTTRGPVVFIVAKNESTRAATLEIPATIERAPAPRRASDDATTPQTRPIQLENPPSLHLTLSDRAGQVHGGTFLGAGGEPGGGYSFVAAPGDAIRLGYMFVPTVGPGPHVLLAQFSQAAGSLTAKVDLSQAPSKVEALAPTDSSSIAGRDEAIDIGPAWRLRLLSLSVGDAMRGVRTVSARLRVENRDDVGAIIGASRDDPTGSGRDFYVVDDSLVLAYSSSDSMPSDRIPPGSTREITIRMTAPEAFSTKGPWRFSIVSDARRNRFAVMRLPAA
jgi:hypothetical protein